MRDFLNVFKRVFCRVSLFAILILSMLLPTMSAQAVMVEDIFTAVIPVKAQTPEEFSNGAAIGLEQVLVRLTGKADISRESAIQSALRVADMYLVQFRYEGQSEQGVLLNLSFDQAQVEKLLRDAKIAIWPVDRVPVVVWMVLEDEEGEKALVNADTHPELADALDLSASRRGLVLRYPLLDLADTRVDPVATWDNRDVKLLLEASERYDSSTVLVGRFKVLGDAYEGSWQIADAENEKSMTLGSAAWDKQAELGINLATDTLVARYAIAPAPIAGDGTIVEVSHINDFAAYTALLESVRSISAVRQVFPQKIDGDRVSLKIVAEGQLNQLIDSLNRLPKLESVIDTSNVRVANTLQSPEGVLPASDKALQYRWR